MLELRRVVGRRYVVVALIVSVVAWVGCGASEPAGTGEAAAPEAAPEVVSGAPVETAVVGLPEAGATWCGDQDCPCEEGSQNLHYGKETLQKCKLSGPTVVQGVTCGPHEVAFYPAGGLVRCYLSQHQAFGPYTCSADRVVEFHPEGQLQSCYLAEMAEIGGLWCKDGTALEPDGSLHRCRVEQASELQGFTIPAGDWITMDGGRIYRWEITGEPQTFGELSCQGSLNYLHPDGTLAKCQLASPATVGGEEIPAGESVCFDAEGAVSACSSMSFRTV